MKILIIHHVGPMWERSFDREKLTTEIINHIESNYYDKVIATTLEGGDTYLELMPYVNVIKGWSYGWEIDEKLSDLEYAEQYGIDRNDITESTGHPYAYLYQWIKDLKGHEITLMGGSLYECLYDLETTLEHLDIPYNTVYECTY